MSSRLWVLRFGITVQINPPLATVVAVLYDIVGKSMVEIGTYCQVTIHLGLSKYNMMPLVFYNNVYHLTNYNILSYSLFN